MSLNTMKKIAAAACLTSATALFGTASAHVVLEYQVAPAGASYKAAFKVGHAEQAGVEQQLAQQAVARRGARGFRGHRRILS